MYRYDILIVGAGLYGSVYAYKAKQKGLKCLVIDKRLHIGGNCFTKNIDGINVHEYGPHIFHTKSSRVWLFINQFTEFNNFVYRPKVIASDGNLYSFPINLMTLYQVFGVKDPDKAKILLQSEKSVLAGDNLESWVVANIGNRLYQLFIKHYTEKQWGISPKELPSSIIKRIPIRYTFEDNYFTDKYQGIPIGGYTQIFEKLLEGVDVQVNTPFTTDMLKYAPVVIYTGTIDEYFNFKYGELEYRSLKFEHEHYSCEDKQGNAVINYTGREPWTRIIEHKHFEQSDTKSTIVTKEFPCNWYKGEIPYYPIETDRNLQLYTKYKELGNNKVRFRGRLGSYKYLNMDQVIESALIDTDNEL